MAKLIRFVTLLSILTLALTATVGVIPASAAAGYHAAFFSESNYLTKSPGESGQFVVGYTNTGDRPWVKGTPNQQATLATDGPADNLNDFNAGWGSGWLSSNRYTAQDASLVAPGQVGFFTYSFTVPANAPAGEHRFNGRAVIDGVTRMEDYGYYHSVIVTRSAAPTLTALTLNSGPNVGGSPATVAGSGFICAPTLPTVSFGPGYAGTVMSCSTSSLVVNPPAHPVGQVSFTVTNTGSAPSNRLAYAYLPRAASGGGAAPRSQDIRLAPSESFFGDLEADVIFTVAFDKAMSAPPSGATIRFNDEDGTVGDVVCGSNAECVLNETSTTIGAVTYPAGQVITVTMTEDLTIITAGEQFDLQLPGTVVQSTGITDTAGNAWNIPDSPDKVLEPIFRE